MLLFSQLVILAERWSVAIRSAEEMTVDLRRLIDISSSITAEIRLDALLRKIVEATSKFLHADRSSLFLYDAKTNELIATVAEGLETRQVRFAANLGIAGHCFTTGAVINVQDAYSDPRFNRQVDDLTGYRTRSLLTMPVAARDGRRLGVMQALNRRDAKGFEKADIARMSAFAAQAAIAIDNATLFSEVVSARNYNESILRSMSNGVITFDSETRIAKINASAAAILEISADAIVGMDAQTMLEGGANAWILDELKAVRADNQPRSFLDVDVRTYTGKTISANVSVVPLVGEADAPVGLLILIEDISEEKRLEGAMRRFMTQKVVDQVLQRQDELLFGTSCTASVLFADIRNFTTMAEALSARETVDMLNEIFTRTRRCGVGVGRRARQIHGRRRDGRVRRAAFERTRSRQRRRLRHRHDDGAQSPQHQASRARAGGAQARHRHFDRRRDCRHDRFAQAHGLHRHRRQRESRVAPAGADQDLPRQRRRLRSNRHDVDARRRCCASSISSACAGARSRKRFSSCSPTTPNRHSRA